MSYIPQTVNLELGVASGSAITVGEKGHKSIAVSGNIVGYSVLADPAATLTFALWKANGALPTIADKITPVSPPGLTADDYDASNSIVGWSTGVITKGDIVTLEILSNDVATFILVNLIIKVN